MSLGSRLRTLREQRNFGQAEVAAEFDVSIPTVSEWESDKKRPGRERLAKMARFYDVPMEYLMSGQMPEGLLRDQSELLLVDLFRHVDEDVKASVLTILKASASINRA